MLDLILRTIVGCVMRSHAEIAADLSHHVRSTLMATARDEDGCWPGWAAGTVEARDARIIERVRVHPPKWVLADLGRAVAAELERGDETMVR